MAAPIRIAVTCGEPGGIGPEVALKAIASINDGEFVYSLVGPKQVWLKSLAAAGLTELPPNSAIVDPLPGEEIHWSWGRITDSSARAALASVEKGIELALGTEAESKVDCLVTAPLTKEGLKLAGCDAPGHTELLGERCSASPTMMFYSTGLKVVLATTHLPLAQVAASLSTALILEKIEACHNGLTREFGLPAPRIAVCGLNPHAGENGRLGDEEISIIAPAIRTAVERNINAIGPIPADAGFAMAHQGEFDVVLAIYHDQGLAPFKMLHFDDGVNVTLGLPIVRTSPDHGTAFDIAGRGEASPGSMIEAIKCAARIARNRLALSRKGST